MIANPLSHRPCYMVPTIASSSLSSQKDADVTTDSTVVFSLSTLLTLLLLARQRGKGMEGGGWAAAAEEEGVDEYGYMACSFVCLLSRWIGSVMGRQKAGQRR